MAPDRMWRAVEKLKVALKVVLLTELGLNVEPLCSRLYEKQLLEHHRD